MKFSLNGIRQITQRYKTSDDVTSIGIDKLMEKIGAQLGAVEEVIDLGKKYDNIAVVKVVSCEKHPDADKLSVCLVDDGSFFEGVDRNKDHLIQVVCGAPNVKADMLAAWIPPGATVPSTIGKEPFVIEAREIRGVVSNGMLASPKELDLGDTHDGILEVDKKAESGTPFTEVYLLSDHIVDIENKMFTHRPDAFGWLGIARELAGIQGMAFKSPDWYVSNPEFPAVEDDELKLEVKNELPESVPRFTAIAMSDVKVGPSPVWLQVALAKVGQKSINNIVDYTNFYMQLTGQPLHAYDYDKVKERSGGDGATIVIRNPKSGEKIKLLNGKEIEPRPEAIMIATDKELIGLGGVMGGTETEVDEKTTNIILEAATFDMYSIRRTSMAHGLFTDAVTRFTKGQSPLQNLVVQAEIVGAIRSQAGGKVASPMIDDNHLDQTVLQRNSLHPPVTISTEFVNARLGLKLSADQTKQLLENVEFQVDVKSDELTVTAPFWRTDIELREDVVEEIGRLYGYDHLPLELPLQDISPAHRDSMLDAKDIIRQRLSKAGANEVLTYSFVPGDLLTKVGQEPEQAFQVANALSPELQYYRLSLMPCLLDKVHANIKAGYDELALFELGKTHSLDQIDDDGLPKEWEFTAFVVAAAEKLKKPAAAYYQAQAYLSELVGAPLEFKPISEAMLKQAVAQPYDPKRSAFVSLKEGGISLGVIGEFKPSVRKQLKLPRYSAGFEINTTELGKVLNASNNYRPLPRFPKVSQDITLKVSTDLSYQELTDFVQAELDKSKPDNSLFTLEPIDIYQKEEDQGHKHVTYRVAIANYDRTMTDQEVNAWLEEVAAAAKTKFGAERL